MSTVSVPAHALSGNAAEDFTALVRDPNSFTEEARLATVERILVAGGFTPLTVELKVAGHDYEERNPEPTRPFKTGRVLFHQTNPKSGCVITEDITRNRRASNSSAWLEQLCSDLEEQFQYARTGQSHLTQWLERFLNYCHPLPLCVISEYGDLFQAREGVNQKWDKKLSKHVNVMITRDDELVQYPHSNSGWHAGCGGEISLKPSSPTHSALLCKRCCLRVPLPAEIAHYGTLLDHFDGRYGPPPS
jgi:hypothetical protein